MHAFSPHFLILIDLKTHEMFLLSKVAGGETKIIPYVQNSQEIEIKILTLILESPVGIGSAP